MRRIEFAVVLAVGLALAPVAAEAQATKVYRIGFMAQQSAADLARYVNAFRQGLREHGYVEGQNLLIEWRFAEGRYDRLQSFATELVGMKVDVVVTLSTKLLSLPRKRRRRFRSFSRRSQIPSPRASSLVWRGQAAIYRDSL
jgi:ABC-type uncharacterized transport system substrate-binding protein